ncbi:MAG: Free methionine-R-sulfoxide reductase [Firmicutes bacterium ADurb.Bin182]|nr:MAG: Free methionine-R-sulfoxide reductase [Firmicutes bacterium ADurb.Bin182]
MVNIEFQYKDKREFYEQLNLQLRSLIKGETDIIANLANASALICCSLNHINWSGFYILKNNELVLGPFQGKPACVRIPAGRGVCGTAVMRKKTILVENVHEFQGHIACDSASESEIVVPIFANGIVAGVLDIDSPVLNRFDEEDKKGLEEFVSVLERGCDWSYHI